MSDRLDCELRAIEAEAHAESASTWTIASNWRDIARSFRLLSDYLADAQSQARADRQFREPGRNGWSGASHGPPDVPRS
jgi:hypothetical protein